jgi:peptide/nickel transport system ATP-binding protein/oligopeptide transport system ATP-binding protein
VADAPADGNARPDHDGVDRSDRSVGGAATSTGSNGSTVLDVTDLTVRFRTRGPRRAVVHAVTDVSFDLRPGETLGLIGESGSGKSTVARAVSQLLRHDGARVSGMVTLAGQRLDQLSRRELRSHRHRMQMVFQDPNDALDPRMTVGRSIAEPLRILKGRRGAELQRSVDDALDAVGLPPSMGDRRPHELSGGQRQRVNVARALVLEPDVILCDEVVSALDVSIQADILALLARLQAERGLAYLFISHDLGVVASLSDRIGVMYLGRLVEVGTTAQVVAAPRHPYTEALLSAEPEALPRRLRLRNRIILEGDVPSPIDPPSGCALRTRCRYAQERCGVEVPPLTTGADGHRVACHFADELTLVGRAAPATT